MGKKFNLHISATVELEDSDVNFDIATLINKLDAAIHKSRLKYQWNSFSVIEVLQPLDFSFDLNRDVPLDVNPGPRLYEGETLEFKISVKDLLEEEDGCHCCKQACASTPTETKEVAEDKFIPDDRHSLIGEDTL